MGESAALQGARRLLVLVSGFFTLGFWLFATGCAHTATEEEQAQAVGQYAVGLALVLDAQKYGAANETSGADSKWRHALAELQKAEKLDDKNPQVQYLLGLVYFVGFRREAETLQHLKSAIANNPDGYPEAEHLIGTALVDFGRPEEALPFLDSARQNLLYQTPYFAQQELGWAYFKMEKYEQAAKLLEAAIVSQPDLCNAYVRLADVEEARGDHERVSDVLTDFIARCDSDRLRALCGDPLLVYGYYRLGMTQMKLGQPEPARASFEICTERFAKLPTAKECARSLQLLQTP